MNTESRLDLLLSMNQPERRTYLLNEKVESEQYWLQVMLDGWKADRSYTMSDIRTQRKGVQRWQKRLNEARAKLVKSE